MKCPLQHREGTEYLLEYVSGALETDKSAAFRSHLDECPACAQFVREQQAVWSALDAFDAEPVSADFNRRLYQRIAQPVTWRQRIASSWQTLRFWNGLPIAGAAAAALLVGGLIWQMPTSKPHVYDHPVTAQVEALPPEKVENALDDMEMLRDLNRVMHTDSSDSGKM